MKIVKYPPALSPIVLALCFVAAAATANPFVPDSEPWAIWEPSNEASDISVDHGAWQSLLDTYLITATDDGINRFDYAAVSAADGEKLDAYLDRLAATDVGRLARVEQQAYWINMYNALTVKVVLEHYPVKSIRKIYGGLFDTGPWNEPLIEVAGVALTLNDIEHRILRPIWRDPRIHYAVNCASLGCPNLAARVYSSANIEELLDAGARAFVNHPRGVDASGRRLTLSSIYDWYGTDFGATRDERLQHLRQYAEPELAAKLGAYEGRIRYDYDWRLNER